MFELIYRSVAVDHITRTDITDILNTARDFNEKNNITGCLLYHNGEFVQILEGDKKTVQDLYANIEKDKRHMHVLLLAEDEKKERMFKNWSMAFHEFNPDDIENIKKTLFVDNFTSIAKFSEKPTYAIKLFWYIAKQILEV